MMWTTAEDNEGRKVTISPVAAKCLGTNRWEKPEETGDIMYDTTNKAERGQRDNIRNLFISSFLIVGVQM